MKKTSEAPILSFHIKSLLVGHPRALSVFWFVLAVLFATSTQALETSVSKLASVPAWVTPITSLGESASGSAKHSGGVSFLLSDQQVLIKGDKKERYEHYIFKIVNANGLSNASNIEIGFDPSYQSMVVHSLDIRRGGQVFKKLFETDMKVLQREKSLEQLIFDGSKTANLFLEDVRVGDVVEYAFTLTGSNPVFKGKQSGRFNLQWDTPLQSGFWRLLAEPSRSIKYQMLNTTMQPAIRDVGEFREYVWRSQETPAMEFRDDVPIWFDPQPRVQWTDFQNWSEVVSWAIPLYRVPDDLPEELRKEVERIRGTSSKTSDQAIEALRYVQKSIRYLGVEVGPGSHAPNSPSVVLSRKYGDCKDKTLLTVSLLQALGIDAAPALVNTKTGRGVGSDIASPYAFNHVIVHAVIEGEAFWLDPTMLPQAGSLRDIYQGNYGLALVLRKGETALSEMILGPASTYARRVNATYDATRGIDKPVLFTVTTLLEGRSAERLRNRLENDSADSMQKQLANYFASFYTGIAVERPYGLYDNLDANQIVLTEYYAIPDFWKKLDGDNVEGYFAAPDVYDYLRNPRNTLRTEPLGIFHPIEVMQTMYVLIPEGWKLKASTSPVKDPSFDFSSKVTVEPGRLIEVDSYRSLKDFVDAKDMQSYLANLKKARNYTGYTMTRSVKEFD